MEEGKQILINVHESYRLVVAICDEELYGKKFVEDKAVLDLTGNFFKGEPCDLGSFNEQVRALVREDATFNIIGERSVEAAWDLGIIKKEGIMKIDGVPFALVLL